MRHHRHMLVLAVSVPLLPALAQGATICVDPQGGPCQATIRGAVDVAGPGDLITIAAGVYYETVVVPPGKDALQFVGAGQDLTIVDSGPYFDLGMTDPFAPSFDIGSHRVRATALTVRNGYWGFLVRAPGALVENVHLEAARGSAVLGLEGASGMRLLGNRVDDCVQGLHAQDAASVTIRGNVVSRGGTAIRVQGPRAVVDSNRLEAALGIQVVGDEALVQDNVIRNAPHMAIQVSGRNPRVLRNTMAEVDMGIVASCPQDAAPPTPPPADACATGILSANTVTDALGEGVLVLAHAPGLQVQGNRVLRAGGPISLNGTGIRALSNTITDSGRNRDFPCFEAFGSDHVLTQNVAARCTASGFLVEASRVRLEVNQALGGFENGITVSGHNFPAGPHVDNVVLGNTANENVAFGIAVVGNAARTTVSGNTALRNRTDFCDQGTGTVVTGNRFGTTGACP